MATPWQQVLEQVSSLNDRQAPFSYSVSPEGAIVGFWDVAKIDSLGLGSASTFDKEYRIDVRPTADGEIDFTEQHTESGATVSSDGLSGEKSLFKGKSAHKAFKVEFNLFGSNHGEPSNPTGYVFDTSAIKDPLFGFLEQHGWKKPGLIGRLFG